MHLCASGRVLHGVVGVLGRFWLAEQVQVELEFGSYEQYDAQRHDALKRRADAHRGHAL